MPTFAAVDRAAFLPDRIWPFDVTRQSSGVLVERATAPDAWYAAADGDVPIVTQWDDGRHRGDDPGHVATSSSSMPSVVWSLLRELSVENGMKVLDVGTGTGETAGALTHRLGHARVTTVEVDAAVSAHARERLCRLGLYPEVVVGDAVEGPLPGGPYDRVLATVGVREVPEAWIGQTRDGAIVLAPWGTHFTTGDAMVRLSVKGGVASGSFVGLVEFMKLRSQRAPAARHADCLAAHPFGEAEISRTEVPEAEFTTGRYTLLPFVLGLRVPRCVRAVAERRDGRRPVWFYGLADRSWACVLFEEGAPEAQVWQAGPRRLWEEVAGAYEWWVARGRPEVTRFGLTVGPEGPHAWLEDPAASWPVG
ncbi:methyltransferase domain-containing protein [Streptomyces alkaliterrae]|uniref:methyltransferase domain-containing protein n=1 Tax=Streptomyces alkaliterrae TaxID=2213162 RepID=UPI001E313373|nr:methyltransferase domain-containing protein [Streptomyces alkaliterrae]